MKKKVLKTITSIAAVTAMISISCLDSDSYIPAVIALVSVAWLGLFTYANREALNRWQQRNNLKTK